MNRTQFVESVANRALVPVDTAHAVLGAIADEIAARLSKGEQVKITGFGIFEKRRRSARVGRNPRTGEKVRVRATSYPHFRPGTELRDVVAGTKKPVKAPAIVHHATAKIPPIVRTPSARRSTARSVGLTVTRQADARGKMAASA